MSDRFGRFEDLPERRRRAVVDAAAEVFGGEDYARASTADIASRAGVSKSQLFFYFHNKRELYLYVLGALTRRVAETVVDERWYEIDDFFDVLLCDAARLPLRDGSFDVAWCNDSFHHYPDPERAAFQAWLVLAPGGALVVGDAWQPAPARAIMNAWVPHSKEGDVRIYSEAEMRRILGTWFSDVSWRRVSQTACVAVARKGT